MMDFEHGQESGCCDVADVLRQLQQVTEISHIFAPFLEGLIQVGFFLKFNASVFEVVGEKRTEAIFSAFFALIVHDVVVVADGVEVNIGAALNAADLGSSLRAHRV